MKTASKTTASKTTASKTTASKTTVVKNSGNVKKPVLNGGLFNRTELDNKIKKIRQRVDNMISLSFEKAVAHLENPAQYPLPAGDKSIEKAFYQLLLTVPNNRRNKTVDKINETLKASPSARTAKYDNMANVNFKSAVSVLEQVKVMPHPEELKLNETETNELLEEFRKKADKPKKTGYATSSKPVPQQAASASKISFFVDNMTCLNPDDVRKDEISIAGVAIDSVGNSVQLAPLFVGKFRKDETVNLNANNKLFTLNIDPAQLVQNFSVNLFIIESDLISNEDTVFKLSLTIGLIAFAIAVFCLVVAIFPPAFLTLPIFMTLFLSGAGLGILGTNIIPLMGDDISLETVDTLLIDDKVDIGETFARSLTIGKGFDINSTFDGKYTASARWVGEA